MMYILWTFCYQYSMLLINQNDILNDQDLCHVYIVYGYVFVSFAWFLAFYCCTISMDDRYKRKCYRIYFCYGCKEASIFFSVLLSGFLTVL